MRPERDDSVKQHYRRYCSLFQSLDSSPALRDATCGFCAAYRAVPGLIFRQACPERRIRAILATFPRHKCQQFVRPAAIGACWNRASRRWVKSVPLESRMYSVFVPSESSLKKVAVEDLAALPESAVWIDLV